MKKPTIRILSNLARAGGTLVGRCLGAINSVVLLSEIHPRGTHIFNPIAQAHDWYGLIKAAETRRQYDFPDAIQLIEQRCREAGRTLVIRDWAHLDYIGHPFIDQPPYRNLLMETLAPAFDIVQFSLVRHPVDQWISTSSLKVMDGPLELDKFMTGYRCFAEQSARAGFMRFEDFTCAPVPQMQKLCDHLDMDFDAGFMDHWHENSRVTGDISRTSRGSAMNEIRPLARHAVNDELMTRFRRNRDYMQAIELLGYTGD